MVLPNPRLKPIFVIQTIRIANKILYQLTWLLRIISASLDTRLRFEPVCVLRFCSFFFSFFFSRVLAKRGYCSCTVQWTVTANVDFSIANSDHVLFMDPQIPLFSNFFIKNGSHGTIYTFKNYFATMISAISFQFQQNKSYPNRP